MKQSAYGIIIAALLSSHAHAEMACAEHDKLAKVLNDQYHEFVIGMAFSGKSEMQNVIEIFVSKEGTWTAMKTNKQGAACLVDSGEHWKVLTPEIEGTKT
jgi:hypothetical protein